MLLWIDRTDVDTMLINELLLPNKRCLVNGGKIKFLGIGIYWNILRTLWDFSIIDGVNSYLTQFRIF